MSSFLRYKSEAYLITVGCECREFELSLLDSRADLGLASVLWLVTNSPLFSNLNCPPWYLTLRMVTLHLLKLFSELEDWSILKQGELLVQRFLGSSIELPKTLQVQTLSLSFICTRGLFNLYTSDGERRLKKWELLNGIYRQSESLAHACLLKVHLTFELSIA